MSTRGFVGFVVYGDEKITFNHYDSYPEGVGQKWLQWLRSSPALSSVRERAAQLQMIPGERLQDERDGDEDIDDTLLRNASRVAQMGHVLPEELLDAGAAIDDHEFPLDSLFAEYGYLVNLDDEVFECYRGFQTAPHANGRFARRVRRDGKMVSSAGTTYYPVALTMSWPLSALPSDEEFAQAFW